MLTKKLRLEVSAMYDDIIETSSRVLLYFRGVGRVVKPDKSQGILDKKFMQMFLSCSIRLRYYKKKGGYISIMRALRLPNLLMPTNTYAARCMFSMLPNMQDDQKRRKRINAKTIITTLCTSQVAIRNMTSP